MIPTPHTVTIITPGETTDGYGDTVLTYDVPPATTRDMAGFAQPQATTEVATGDRRAVTWDLVFFTEDQQITARERLEWRGVTYEVDGRPDSWETPSGFHHVELRLRAVKG